MVLNQMLLLQLILSELLNSSSAPAAHEAGTDFLQGFTGLHQVP